MKRIFFILIAAAIVASCSEPVRENLPAGNQSLVNTAIKEMTKAAEQDTGFDQRVKNNSFRNEAPGVLKDLKLSNKIQGSWELVGNISLEFLSTKLHPYAKVVFVDSVTSTMTSWGKITYNTSANFYVTEDASDRYEYYIGFNKRLILTRVNYLNNDLSYKKTPELDTISFAISFPDKNTLVLSSGNNKFKLMRKN